MQLRALQRVGPVAEPREEQVCDGLERIIGARGGINKDIFVEFSGCPIQEAELLGGYTHK